MNELKITLDGLSCAHCASKIEEKVKKLDNVISANLNFMNKYILVEHNSTNHIIYNAVKSIVNKLEPDVKVSSTEAEESPNLEEQITSSRKSFKDMAKKHKKSTSSCDISEIECDCGCNGHSHANEKDNIYSDHSEEHSHSHSHSSEGEENTKFALVKIILGAILFIAGIISGRFSELASMILSIAAYAILGYDILFTAVKNIVRGQLLDENFLMALASLGAMFIGDYPEAAGVMLFYQIGEFCQDIAVNKSRKQIKSLLNIKPDYANIKTATGTEKVNPEIVKIDDIIVVKPGEKIPLDGVIVDGASSVDTSALTGESMPVDVAIGENVLSGSINLSGVLNIKVSKEFKESTVSKILYLVEKATDKKSETESFITKFAKYYTPSVVGIAVLIAVIPTFIFQLPYQEWLYKGLTFLVVSCPCALVLSIPLSYFSGLGCASKYGILIKGGNYLEALSMAETAVFDKTGTLTEGNFYVAEICASNGFTEDSLLNVAALGEYYSNHPIAKSIKDAYTEKTGNNIDAESLVKNYTEIAGHGVTALINNEYVAIGNEKLMNRENIAFTKATDKPGTVLYISQDSKFAGYIVISDKVKNDAKQMITNLKSLGIIQTIMLTGDNKVTANHVKEQVGLDKAYSELLPNNKLEIVEELKKNKDKKKKLIYVGDGINDAPVLVGADIGIAMGGIGSDAAVEAADVVIVNDEPSRVVDSIKIAKKTKAIVWQNIILCLGVKLAVMILTVYGNVSMPLAVFADVGVALIAILNASRILRTKL